MSLCYVDDLILAMENLVLKKAGGKVRSIMWLILCPEPGKILERKRPEF